MATYKEIQEYVQLNLGINQKHAGLHMQRNLRPVTKDCSQ